MSWAIRPPEATTAPSSDHNLVPGLRPGAVLVVCSRPLWSEEHPPLVKASSPHRRHTLAALVLIGVAGCGGDERQDENEAEGNFRVEVVDASFPERQRLAQSSVFEITLRNAGSETIPNVAVTVNGFGYPSGTKRSPTRCVRDSL